MACDAILGQGAQLLVSDMGSPPTFTAIVDLRDITPNLTRESIDASNHDTVNAWREFVPGMAAMTVGLEGNYVPADPTHNAGADGMLGLLDSGETRDVRIIFPDVGATQWDFEAFFTEVSPGLPSEGLLNFTASMQICGRPTLQ
jgi:predicted secreted protein